MYGFRPNTCFFCNGSGQTDYCVNPDNGHFDTPIHMLRYEKVKCYECNGTGIKPEPAKPRKRKRA